MKVGVSFGVLSYAIDVDAVAPVPPWVQHDAAGDARRVFVYGVDVLPEMLLGSVMHDHGFVVQAQNGTDHVWVCRSAPHRWVAALSAIVARDAPAAGALVVHCAALRVRGGVALVVAPCGTGKTTLAAGEAKRSFAHNAVLVSREVAAGWGCVALPFAGDPRPELDAPGREPVVLIARLQRATQPGFEWIRRVEATTSLLQACVRPPGRDPMAAERFMIASELVSAVSTGRLYATPYPGALDALDARLHTEPFSP
jgi:hypothetical protein